MSNEQHSSENWVTHYVSAGKMFFYFMAGIACVPAGFYFMSMGKAKATFAGVLFIIIGPILALKVVRYLLGGAVVFRYNADEIHVPGFFGTKRLLWTNIQKIIVIERSRYIWGFIKVGSTQSLYVHPSSGWKVHVPTNWAGLNNDDMHQLAAKFERLRLQRGAVGTPQYFTADTPEPKNDYADAVVARYLARKKEEESSAFSRRPEQPSHKPQNGGIVFGKRLNPP